MNRNTLSEVLDDRLGLSVREFARRVGIPHTTLTRYYKENRLLVKYLISGYQVEVRKRY